VRASGDLRDCTEPESSCDLLDSAGLARVWWQCAVPRAVCRISVVVSDCRSWGVRAGRGITHDRTNGGKGCGGLLPVGDATRWTSGIPPDKPSDFVGIANPRSLQASDSRVYELPGRPHKLPRLSKVHRRRR